MSLSFLLLATLGVGVGVVSGLVGIGGGVLYVPALMYFLGLPIHKAIGISLAVVVASAFAAASRHAMSGNVDIWIVLVIAPGAILGAVLGAYLSGHVPAPLLRRMFGVVLILVGINALFEIDKRFISAKTEGEAASQPLDEGEHLTVGTE